MRPLGSSRQGKSSSMLTPDQCRRIDPSLDSLSDEEIGVVLDRLYLLGELAHDFWVAENSSSKNPTGVMPRSP